MWTPRPFTSWPPVSLAVAAVFIACLARSVSAVPADKVAYLGGTQQEFPRDIKGPYFASSTGNPKIEGRLSHSETEFTFEAGRWGTLTIPYRAIASMDYGLEAGRHGTRSLILILPWEITEQYTSKPHYLLTIAYQDQSGTDQAVLLELGADVMRPTIEALQRRTGKSVDFLDVDSCLLFKSADACNYGRPAELRGLKRIFLAPTIPTDARDVIVRELAAERLGVELSTDAQGAEIFVDFRKHASLDPQCPCTGGRGVVSVLQGEHRRVVLVAAGRKKGVWGKQPEITFVRAFADAFRAANGQK